MGGILDIEPGFSLPLIGNDTEILQPFLEFAFRNSVIDLFPRDDRGLVGFGSCLELCKVILPHLGNEGVLDGLDFLRP